MVRNLKKSEEMRELEKSEMQKEIKIALDMASRTATKERRYEML